MADAAVPTETSIPATTETAAAPADAANATALGSAGGEATVVDTGVADADSAEAAKADTAKADEAAAIVVPDKYELTASEGFTLDPAALEVAEPVFKELGLSNEQAQTLMPVAEKFAQQITDRNNAAILSGVAEQRAAWLGEAKADAEIGGQAWDSSLITAAKALDTLGFTKGSPFRALLDDSGLGNHPEMIRAFVKVGKAISEDSDFARSGAATSGPRSNASTLYPSKS